MCDQNCQILQLGAISYFNFDLKRFQRYFKNIEYPMDHLHWQHLLAKPLVTVTRNSHLTVATVLALATLGDATQIGSFLFLSLRPR
jgi:hypothetical protein